MKKYYYFLPLLLLSSITACQIQSIDKLTTVAEKTLINFNIDYTSIICFKDYDHSANCVVLTKDNHLSNMYCDYNSCEIYDCNNSSCLQKIKSESVNND